VTFDIETHIKAVLSKH